jgi:hypothetical protein
MAPLPEVTTSSRQPALGLKGLGFVTPIAAVLAIGAGGEGSVRVLAPIITFSLPLLVMVGFWWADWPGTRYRSGATAAWIDTLLVAGGAIVLTGAGQVVVGHLDLAGMFDPSIGPGHVPTFPATLPLAGTAFIAMLEVTLVGEGWPLDRLDPLAGGLLSVAIAWVVAVVLYLSVVDVRPPSGSDVIARDGPVPAALLGSVLVLIGAWQVLVYVCWRGWPLSTIARRGSRLACAHAVVLGLGLLSFAVTHALLGLDPARIASVAGCFIAAGLVLGMLLEDWLAPLGARTERVTLLLATVLLTAVLAVALSAAAHFLPLAGLTADDWVEHAALNAVSTAILLHVAIGRRWPFVGDSTDPGS